MRRVAPKLVKSTSCIQEAQGIPLKRPKLIFLCHEKPKNNGSCLIKVGILVYLKLLTSIFSNLWQDGNGLQLEKFRLTFSSCFRVSSKNRC